MLAILSRRRHSIYHTPLVAVYQTGRKGFLWLAGEKEREGGRHPSVEIIAPLFLLPPPPLPLSSFRFLAPSILQRIWRMGGEGLLHGKRPKRYHLKIKRNQFTYQRKACVLHFRGISSLFRPPIPPPSPLPSFRFLGVGMMKKFFFLPSAQRERRGGSPLGPPRG